MNDFKEIDRFVKAAYKKSPDRRRISFDEFFVKYAADVFKRADDEIKEAKIKSC